MKIPTSNAPRYENENMEDDSRYIRVSVESLNKQLEQDEKREKLNDDLYSAGETALNSIAMFLNYCGSNNIRLPEWLEKYNTQAFNQLTEAINQIREDKLINKV